MQRLLMFRSVLASDKVTDQKDGFSDVIGLLENNFPGDQTDNFPDDRTHTVPEHDSKTNYRFSVGQLPSWAKKQASRARSKYFVLVLIGTEVTVSEDCLVSHTSMLIND